LFSISCRKADRGFWYVYFSLWAAGAVGRRHGRRIFTVSSARQNGSCEGLMQPGRYPVPPGAPLGYIRASRGSRRCLAGRMGCKMPDWPLKPNRKRRSRILAVNLGPSGLKWSTKRRSARQSKGFPHTATTRKTDWINNFWKATFAIRSCSSGPSRTSSRS